MKLLRAQDARKRARGCVPVLSGPIPRCPRCCKTMTVQNNQAGLEAHPTAPPAQTPGAAHAGEAQFQFLANALPQIVWTAQPNGGMDYFNQRWFEYTGLTLEQSQNLGWH